MLNKQTMTATLVASFVHPTPLLAASQGDFQPLAGGNWFVGWGQEPFFSEFSPEGKVLFDAHLPSLYQSYTMLKFPWSGEPAGLPAIAARRGAHGGIEVYTSWNGATQVASWRVLEGATATSLTPAVAQAPRKGFETAIPSPGSGAYVAAQALGVSGQVLGASTPVMLRAALGRK